MKTILQKYKDYLLSLNVSRVTEKSYISDVKQFLETKGIKDVRDLRKLSDDDVDIYVQSLAILKKPLTIKRKRSTLKHFLNFLKLTNMVERPLSQKLPSSVVSIPLSQVLIVAYLLIFTAINVFIVFSKKDTSIPSVELSQVSSLPDNIKLNEAQVMSMEGSSTNVFTVSADDGANPFGQAVIENGQKEVTIYNKSVTPNAVIFVTPVNDLKGQSLYLKSVNNGSFVVALSSPTTAVLFNWLARTPTVNIY